MLFALFLAAAPPPGAADPPPLTPPPAAVAPAAPWTQVVGTIVADSTLPDGVRPLVEGVAQKAFGCMQPGPLPFRADVMLTFSSVGGHPVRVRLFDEHGARLKWDGAACVMGAFHEPKYPWSSSVPFVVVVSLAAAADPNDKAIASARARVSAERLRTSADATTARKAAPAIDYDRFKGTTAVTQPIEVNGPWTRASLFSVLKGDGSQLGPALEFYTVGPEWQYLKCHSVAMLADGAPIRLGPPDHDGDVGEGNVSERILVMVDRSQLERIAKAAKVELRVCADEFVLAGDTWERTRAFLEHVPARASDDAVPPPTESKTAPVPL